MLSLLGRLAGGSASATLAELGYNVKSFLFPRFTVARTLLRHKVELTQQKNYQGDGDSVFRLFYETVKGGDYRARESNVHRLAEVSANIIDQCVSQGVLWRVSMEGYWTILEVRLFLELL
jgi:succinate dehydrogenase / fumarate reductase flavoprotein subunit